MYESSTQLGFFSKARECHDHLSNFMTLKSAQLGQISLVLTQTFVRQVDQRVQQLECSLGERLKDCVE
jgi:hypothetical protein